MPLTVYEEALAGLSTNAQQIRDAFSAWTSDSRLSQVSCNVANETALEPSHFTALLLTFASKLTSSGTSKDAWIAACREHKFKGRVIPSENCPLILGRAKGLEHHADAVEKASKGSLTKQEAKKWLLKYSGSHSLAWFEPFLRDALLGNFLVWATFNPDNHRTNPFDRLPQAREEIYTALGLGDFRADDALIVLIWSHLDTDSPPLHRPTIADAEDFPFYRPCTDIAAAWGLTEPLSRSSGLQPQPEVVMPQKTSKGLQLPFRIF